MMRSQRSPGSTHSTPPEHWVYKVKGNPGELFLCPEFLELQGLPRETKPGLLRDWDIRFQLPEVMEPDDAARLADLLNAYLRNVICTHS